MSENGTRAPSSRELTYTLKQLRESHVPRISAAAAARHLRVNQTTVTRYEENVIPIRAPYVKMLCELYDADAELTARLVEIADANWEDPPPWWEGLSDGAGLPKWFKTYLGMENQASNIAEYSTVFPGLLQTEEYARLVLSTGPLAGKPDLIDEQLAIRMRRQKILDREPPRRLTMQVYVDESVLMRPVGGATVQRRQLEHVLVASERANLTARVLPFSAGLHAAVDVGPFILLDFPNPSDLGSVYVESPVGAWGFGAAHELQRYRDILTRLARESLDEKGSRERIKQAVDGL